MQDNFKLENFEALSKLDLFEGGYICLVVNKENNAFYTLKRWSKLSIFKNNQVEAVLNDKEIVSGNATIPYIPRIVASMADSSSLNILYDTRIAFELQAIINESPLDVTSTKFVAGKCKRVKGKNTRCW